MTDRERFQRLMRGESVDRLPVMAIEPFEQSAVDRWRGEGLPADVSPFEFLGMTRFENAGEMNLWPIPAFESKVLRETADTIVATTAVGTTVEYDRHAPTTFYGHLDHPVKTRADWDRYKERLIPDDPGRLAGIPDAARAREIETSGRPVALFFFPFFFRMGFYTMGMERFLLAFYDQPDLVHDMFAHVARMVLRLLPGILDAVEVDIAVFNEDLAGKNGPLVSPGLYREFWHPHQDPVLDVLRDAGVPVVCQWSAGRYEELLPDLMAHGFNCIWPLERAAGMDPVAVRVRYGGDLRMGGGIPLEALLAGPEAIDRELERLMPVIGGGGYLPALDDMPPMECPFAHYRHMIERLRAVRPSCALLGR